MFIVLWGPDGAGNRRHSVRQPSAMLVPESASPAGNHRLPFEEVQVSLGCRTSKKMHSYGLHSTADGGITLTHCAHFLGPISFAGPRASEVTRRVVSRTEWVLVCPCDSFGVLFLCVLTALGCFGRLVGLLSSGASKLKSRRLVLP